MKEGHHFSNKITDSDESSSSWSIIDPMRISKATVARLNARLSLDQVAAKIAALGVPGLMLVIAMTATGYTGAAALTTALVALGPGGMLGGIATLGVSVLISDAAAKYGARTIALEVIKELYRRDETVDTILDKIERMPLSHELKMHAKETLEELENTNRGAASKLDDAVIGSKSR